MRQQLFQSGTAAFFVMTTVDQSGMRNASRLCAKMRLNTFSRIGFEEAEHLCI